jgi:hypothetical protein
MTAMDYCGVEFTATESSGGSSWKWQLSVRNKDKLKSSGEASNRMAAIEQAHQAIAEGLRATAVRNDEVPLPQLACGVLHILHGARSLPAADAIEALGPFMEKMRNRTSGTDRFADASTAAVSALVQRLETKGVATDDLWEEAIEASTSFANEVS